MGKIADLAARLVEAAAPGGGGASCYLTFAVCGEMFAIGTPAIKGVIEYGGVSGVPGMPGFIRGVIDLRGAVVPVVDLSARFGRASCEVTRASCIVVVQVRSGDGAQDVGMVVDSVSEVIEIPAADIEPAPSFSARIRTDFLRGMGKLNGRFVLLVDTDRVLSKEQLDLMGRIGAEAARLRQASGSTHRRSGHGPASEARGRHGAAAIPDALVDAGAILTGS
jgi:purine-binding chemotaxis protein CheW